MNYKLHAGDCLEILPDIPDASIDCVISDPPYPCIKRDYGMMSEADWTDMMHEVVKQTRRILKPTGSAVFILQPNSRKVGSMRGWMFEFMAWCIREWNMVQDAWWWNTCAMPTGGATCGGLMRGSVKVCTWLGTPDCYRNQSAVLLEANKAAEYHAKYYRDKVRLSPSGHSTKGTSHSSFKRNGGVSPFNLIPIGVSGVATQSAGAHGHGAGTPLKLADWWTRYICPRGGVVADWFTGSGTMGIAAAQNGCSFVGVEKEPKYYEIAKRRIDEAYERAEQAPALPLAA